MRQAGSSVSGTLSPRGARAARQRLASDGSLKGRPASLYPTEETLRRVVNAGKIQCTIRETAAVMGVALSVLQQFFADCPEVKEMWEDAREGGKRSLRRTQFKAALEGNPQLLIWLGKQYLGQSDKSEVEHSGTIENLHTWIVEAHRASGVTDAIEGQSRLVNGPSNPGDE